MSKDQTNDEKLFSLIGLNSGVVQTTIKNKKLSSTLRECVEEAKIENGCDPAIGKLVYDVATKLKSNDFAKENRSTLLKYIIERKINTVAQLDGAIKYFNTKTTFDKEEFEKASGVGIKVSKEEIENTIDELLKKHQSEIAEQGKASAGKIRIAVNKAHPFGDGKLISELFNTKFEEALKSCNVDPKNSKKQDNKTEKNEKIVKEKNTEELNGAVTENLDEEDVVSMEKWLKGRDLPEAHNTPEQLARRKKTVGEKFLTRFPPEPNGFLHIGHAKAMTFNFSLAEKYGGECYLRFDDTNPEAEKQLYIDNIIENVKWMGFKPWKITYSSDVFEELYQLAIKLIKSGNAYVDHQSKDEIELSRKSFRTDKPMPSPWRDRSIEENLKHFELMRIGYYREGEACLRMKGDIKSKNPNMWDHVAYRIKYIPHPHIGDKWCIYPTYDYTHCIVDSLEWISASCCTLEFENRRESYFWLLDRLDLYKPVVWEYSRLNITYNVLSKRKLLKLVNGGYVRDWDDPRMITINGLRRRGYTAQILKKFCDKIGVTRKENYVSPKLLEAVARDELNGEASRAMCVIKPLKIKLTNYPDNKIEKIDCPNFPQDLSKGTHEVKFNNIVYIDFSDFREHDDKSFFGLSLNKTIRLKYAYNITCNKIIKDNNSNIIEIECTYDPESRHDLKGIKKGHLSWVSFGIKAEFRLYNHLFTQEFPNGDDWLDHLNPDSEIIEYGLVDEHVINSDQERFQFERQGYFCKDNRDYTTANPVFNRTVTLRESTEKKNMK